MQSKISCISELPVEIKNYSFYILVDASGFRWIFLELRLKTSEIRHLVSQMEQQLALLLYIFGGCCSAWEKGVMETCHTLILACLDTVLLQ